MSKCPWSKKTDKLEVRLSPETKADFLETVEQQGETASNVVRRLIEDYVKRFHVPVLAKPLVVGIEAVRRTPLWARTIVGIGAVLGVSLAVMMPSQAEERLPWQYMFEEHWDENKDGRLDPEEYISPHIEGADLETGNADQDAMLSSMRESEFLRMDADANGQVSKAEYEADHNREREKLFSNLDNDGDGRVALPEFLAPNNSIGRASVFGMALGQYPYHSSEKPYPDVKDAFYDWGRMNSDTPPPEVAARLGEMFGSIDADHSDFISLEEFQAQ